MTLFLVVSGRGGVAFSYVCNVIDRETVYSTAERVRKEVGKVSIVVNNAGIVTGKRFLDIPDENIQRTFDVNVLAHFWVSKCCATIEVITTTIIIFLVGLPTRLGE